MAERDDRQLRFSIDRHKRHAREMFEWWDAGQRLKIEGKRGWKVADACRSLARDLINDTAWLPSPPEVRLTVDQIQLCEQRALSRARVAKFGPIPETAAEWDRQMADLRLTINTARPAGAL